jgi:hypothetical protein
VTVTAASRPLLDTLGRIGGRGGGCSAAELHPVHAMTEITAALLPMLGATDMMMFSP